MLMDWTKKSSHAATTAIAFPSSIIDVIDGLATFYCCDVPDAELPPEAVDNRLGSLAMPMPMKLIHRWHASKTCVRQFAARLEVVVALAA